ncbi:NAD(P)/FAD-dependent oxidoreductase [Rhizorhabdus argentea]|uniref:NAD(P)/FAD-dependent oxidoreductase n=1 Tax=Rhizorhabdus argentea TaxID=1387174 RepID=UPI0030ECF196
MGEFVSISMPPNRPRVVVIGAGFAGLAAAYELVRQGIEPVVVEADSQPGGLAASFEADGREIERFYHFWYHDDPYLLDLVEEMGLRDQVVTRPSPTGLYFAGKLFRLTTPLDVLRFTPLPLIHRIRLGLIVLAARRIKSWRELDHISAADWLVRIGGREGFRVVWEPLLVGKFGRYAYEVSAAWFWAKLVLRGGSRKGARGESLMYYKGGFKALVDSMVVDIRSHGGALRLDTPAIGIDTSNGAITAVRTQHDVIACEGAITTTALPIVADVMGDAIDAGYAARLRNVKYLGSMCLVLELDRSLSELYWMNVNDPSFPFVAVIEHTNMDPNEREDGRHIVYLSRYLPADDSVYRMGAQDFLDYTVPHLQRMFPAFERDWIKAFHLWRAPYTQPVTTVGYADAIPGNDTPVEGFKIASMAQIYPEDRGTPHAVREGRKIAKALAAEIRARVPA